MTPIDLLSLVEEGLQNGRISPHLARYIANELQHVASKPEPQDAEANNAHTPADLRALQEISFQ